MLETTQREFWALPLEGGTADGGMREESFDLAAAEADGALAGVASTYSPENDAVYDGLSRPGPRLVTFAPILKQGRFPLAERAGDPHGGGGAGHGHAGRDRVRGEPRGPAREAPASSGSSRCGPWP